ncbi:MAG: IS200/IS605 family transposase [Nitrososphaerota archaeon]|nr:IS200/IS605 family transposase [Nitrososphaerota archaeon]
MQYRHTPHSVQLVNYHIVFAPRYRRQLLVGKRKKRLSEVLREVARDNGWEVIAMEVMPDHVHLFVSADTKTKPEIVVKRFKGRSSHTLRGEFPELLKMPTLWTRSYFLSTAGNVSSEAIQKYIENQWGKKFERAQE